MDAAGLPARLAARLARGRAMAEARMTSRCAVMRKTGYTEQDEETGLEVPVWAAIHVDLPLRLAGVPRGAATHRTVNVGGVDIEVPVRTANHPHDTADLHDGDLLDIYAGETPVVCQILESTGQDQATARRMLVFVVDRPEEWT
ncbi:DUF6093 family protein [Pimelobacter simplex]|uniref:Uncharacterized protein n=1 Tax=Nocardioides simplex TaxID=2045 RepID=A0A0A1DF39_NOCSI|nr:DUF6093 family protein [Pimelobacter simplex]AIY15841.1 hypothetical protein KR76_01960 [Pimelobacter simplex]GEB16667.1 hypothetical protein NSI01_49820 [Pimelobacter simplex]SFM90290.1 hypothetical protein SAMN05421671_4116 [Pimelobacter simplex]